MVQEFWANWSLYGDALLTAMIAGLGLGLLGVYVVARRIVFVSAALSQVAALGVTLGFWALAVLGAQAPELSEQLHEGLPGVMAIGLCALVVSLLVWLGERPNLGRDAVLGVAFILPTALVLIVGPHMAQELHEVEAVLHGSAVLVRRGDLWAIGLATLLVAGTQWAGFRAFVFASLDPVVARTQGLPVRALDVVLFGSIALMTGLVTRAMGALPTFALTVLPAVGALGLNIGLRGVFLLAAATGSLAGGMGYLVAYQTDWSVGASQTLVALALALCLRLGAALAQHLARRPD